MGEFLPIALNETSRQTLFLSLQKNACQIVKGDRIFHRLGEVYWFYEAKELIQLRWKGHTKLRNMKGLHLTEWVHLKVGLV